MEIQRIKSAFDEILSEWQQPRLQTLQRDPNIVKMTENLVLKVEAQRDPERWPVTDYTDDFKEYHPDDHYQWMWLFFHAPFYSAELADVLCFLRCNGSILVRDQIYGYRIQPVIGGHGWKTQQEYDDVKAPLTGYMNEVLALLKNLRLAEQQGVTTIHLEVRTGNGTAIRLYERMGFTKDGIRKKYYTDPVEDALLMTRHPRG